jgi:hypothetical protein
MTSLYFYLNAVIYVLLAVFCTLRPSQTAASIGFTELNHSGRSEYLVVYGGLQLGLGLFYFLLARDPAYARIGILFSLLLYAPMVAYRTISLWMYWPTSAVTLGTAALEILLLLWAFILWRNWRP